MQKKAGKPPVRRPAVNDDDDDDDDESDIEDDDDEEDGKPLTKLQQLEMKISGKAPGGKKKEGKAEPKTAEVLAYDRYQAAEDDRIIAEMEKKLGLKNKKASSFAKEGLDGNRLVFVLPGIWALTSRSSW